MSLVSGNIPNLIGGVSQQPAAIRRENQFESQENAYATLVEGLGPRRPTFHVAKLLNYEVGQGLFWHTINRDLDERYKVVIDGAGALKVFDLADGVEKSVTFPDGTDYLESTGVARSAFKAITVADYTFIVNTEVEVAMGSALTTSYNPEALIFVKQGNYGKTYSVSVNGSSVASYTTPDGGSAAHSANISTDYIATELYNDLAAALTGWTVAQYGSTIHIRAPSSTDFTLNTYDGFSGLALLGIKGTVQRFTDLPRQAPTGFTVGVSGDQGINGDVYYLTFKVSTGSANTGGSWAEAVKPGIEYQLDLATMPHQLIRNGDGTFTFQRAAWIDRLVGDTDTNPDPGFVGKQIRDVFFNRNRLGFVAGENAVSSRSGEFFNFFRRTTTTFLDDDPVDVAVSSVRVATINWAIPFAKQLVLFSERGQHELSADGSLTPRTAAVVPTSEFESSPYARPASTGTSVFFAVEQDGFAQMREYHVNAQSAAGLVDAFDTTEQCPRYIPAGVFKITAAQSENIVTVLTTADPTAIYSYRFHGPPDDRVQSAWGRWDLGGDVLDAEFVKADLYVVVERDGAVWLEYLPFASGKKDTGTEYLTLLDRRVTADGLTVAYDAVAETTTFTLPYPAAGVKVVVGYSAGYLGDLRPGQSVEIDGTSGDDVTVVGDLRDTPLIFGFTYETEVELTKFFVREARGQNSRTTIIDGRLQLRYLTFLVGGTSYFKVRVQSAGREAMTKVFNGRVVGSSSSIIGEVPLYSGKVRIPILGRGDTTTITIIHDSHLPMNILAMEWEGMFTIRSQRIT